GTRRCAARSTTPAAPAWRPCPQASSRHNRQVVPCLLLTNDWSLGIGGVRSDHSRQQVEPRFGLENQHSALALCPPLQLRPDLVAPTLDRCLVALDGPADRRLGRPVQFLEQPADMVLVVAAPKLFFNDLRAAGTGPDLTAKSVSLRAMPEEL